MRKRHLSHSVECMPTKKRLATSDALEPGDILSDINGKEWRLGQPIGEGAFGEIFIASDCLTGIVSEWSPYVAKVELHKSGPLFVETHFYLRVAKLDQINEWKQNNRKTIGIPHYIASGSYTKLSTKYRFLILPRYSIDLQQVFERHGSRFNVKSVLTIALQLIDTLEYIHSCGFIHSDIKASNILINEKPVPIKLERTTDQYKYLETNRKIRLARSCRKKKFIRNLRSQHNPTKEIQSTPADARTADCPTERTNQVYLLDFGLASKYLQSDGKHKEYCVDERRAHAGTILYCSLDAHNGAQSRRSDLESLGYNIVFWLTNILPWMHNIEDYELVKKKKQICMHELENFLHFCFGRNIPIFLKNFFQHINCLGFTESPDYDYCRQVFIQGFNEYGYKKVFTLDFENKEGWGNPQKSSKRRRIKNTENDRRRASVVCSIIRTPLMSNLPAKHVLRKQNKATSRMMRWSRILIDPESIIRESGKRTKEKEPDESAFSDKMNNLNINELNPTETMLEIYNNYYERQNNSELGINKQKSNDAPAIEGYNAAMMAIHNKILQPDYSDSAVVGKSLKLRKKVHKNMHCTSSIGDIKDLVPTIQLRRYNTRYAKQTT